MEGIALSIVTVWKLRMEELLERRRAKAQGHVPLRDGVVGVLWGSGVWGDGF